MPLFIKEGETREGAHRDARVRRPRVGLSVQESEPADESCTSGRGPQAAPDAHAEARALPPRLVVGVGQDSPEPPSIQSRLTPRPFAGRLRASRRPASPRPSTPWPAQETLMARRVRFLPSFALVVLVLWGSDRIDVQSATGQRPQAAAPSPAQPPGTYAALPSETPAKLEPVTSTFDYDKRDVMIPMRDGVKLHTVIIVPKGAKGAPILLTRTPYSATALTSHAEERAPRPDPPRLRQRHRRHRRRRLHPRRPGRPRQVRVGRRLRDEPPAARARSTRRPSITRPTRTTPSTGS